MNIPKIISYEIKNSRTNQKIPVVNGVHLHSIYNPKKEAENLVLTNLDSLQEKKEALILGLGFGYHANAISDKMAQLHGDDYKIFVIEPNQQIYNDCINLSFLNLKNIKIYPSHTPQELYKDLNFIHFLLKKPAIIAHPASFNLYQKYFKEILTFEAPKKIEGILDFLTINEIKNYLKTFNEHSTIEEIIKIDVPSKKRFSELDFLAMALFEMTKEKNKVENKVESKRMLI